ncbi:amino acid ABC transporter permease [Arthrobacter sp. M4]|uniref:amino acid ABC transporter permease n=1 Tax=Arthrobacter sp. M4 TaxID=218160 RepID=UPI001CDB7B7E|nr:amino acid ABC transporter permease [Arthrobacter sp. M4]MCA4132524.1 amino acid ABC transporter permease [Arthrobacter sp. M4]
MKPGNIAALPETRRVVALRHPGRWASAVVVIGFLLWFANVLVTTEAFEWDVVSSYLFNPLVLNGVLQTLEMTAIVLVIGMVAGTIIAIMRLSPNVVLHSVAHFYQWFFRGTPPLVQLIFWFNLASVFPRFELTLFDHTFFSISTNTIMTPFVSALLGLGLPLSAYYSEIVRAGILAVDEGQWEAASAYALTPFQTLRHIVLPQAMRVIIPPTGNEAIGTLKFTSLATIVSFTELLHTVSTIYNTNFQTIPLLIVAALWYLFLTSVLSIGQYFLEQRFAKGSKRAVKQPLISKFWSNVLGQVKTA